MSKVLLVKLISSLWNTTPDVTRSLWSRCSQTAFTVAPRRWDRSTVLRLAWRLPFWGYLLLTIPRLLFLGYATTLEDGHTLPYWQYDVVGYFNTYEIKIINLMGQIIVVPFLLFLLYFDYIIYVKQYNNIWGTFYEYTVVNPADFLANNRRLLPNLDPKRPLVSVRKVLHCLSWIVHPPEHLKRASFKVSPIRFLPVTLTRKMRVQVALLSLTLQAVMALLYGVTGNPYLSYVSLRVNLQGFVSVFLTILLTVLAYIFAFHPYVTTTAGHVILLLDLCIFVYTLIHTFKIFYFFGHGGAVNNFGHRLMELRSHRMVAWSRRCFLQGNMSMEQLATNLHFYQRVHIQALIGGLQADASFVSNMVAIGLLANLLVNLYLVSALFFINFSAILRLGIYGLVALQGIFVAYMFSSLIGLFKNLNNYQKYLYSAFSYLDRRQLPQKLKCMTHFEMICSKYPIAYTIGPMGDITSTAFYEVGQKRGRGRVFK